MATQRRNNPVLPTETSDYQWNALLRVWSDCTQNVPYYRDLLASGRVPERISNWDSFRKLPVLTRRELQDHPEQFVRLTGPPDDFMKTAGSTGTPLRMGMTQAERDLMRVVKLAEWQKFGYTPSSRLFLIWGHSHLLGTGWRGKINHARRKVADLLLGYRRVDAYRLNRDLCRSHARALIRFRPLGLIGYASALDLFARYTEDLRGSFRALGLRFVMSTSEPAPRPDTFPLLEDLFGCPVVQEYGGAEFGQVGFKVGDDPFEVYPDLNIVESESDSSDEPGSILLTSLYPRYVPLIRYRVGDMLDGPETLQHGHVQRFQTLAGRVNDVIRLPGGDHVHSVAVFHCIHQEPSILNIQMELEDGGIEIRLIARESSHSDLESRMRRRLSQVHPLLGQARFRFVDDLETNRAGKRRWFVDKRSTTSA